MKILILSILFIGQSALAAEDFFCTSEERDQTVQLTQVSDWVLVPDVDTVDYRAKYQITLHTTELAFPDLSEEVIADKFDVQVDFAPTKTLDGEAVLFTMFLDELDQAVLAVGNKAYAYTCRPFPPAH